MQDVKEVPVAAMRKTGQTDYNEGWTLVRTVGEAVDPTPILLPGFVSDKPKADIFRCRARTVGFQLWADTADRAPTIGLIAEPPRGPRWMPNSNPKVLTKPMPMHVLLGVMTFSGRTVTGFNPITGEPHDLNNPNNDPPITWSALSAFTTPTVAASADGMYALTNTDAATAHETMFSIDTWGNTTWWPYVPALDTVTKLLMAMKVVE